MSEKESDCEGMQEMVHETLEGRKSGETDKFEHTDIENALDTTPTQSSHIEPPPDGGRVAWIQAILGHLVRYTPFPMPHSPFLLPHSPIPHFQLIRKTTQTRNTKV